MWPWMTYDPLKDQLTYARLIFYLCGIDHLYIDR